MTDMSNFNQTVIDEFRANKGLVGGGFAGAPMVIITTKGAKSGQPAQMQVEERTGKSAAAPAGRNGDRKDLGFPGY